MGGRRSLPIPTQRSCGKRQTHDRIFGYTRKPAGLITRYLPIYLRDLVILSEPERRTPVADTAKKIKRKYKECSKQMLEPGTALSSSDPAKKRGARITNLDKNLKILATGTRHRTAPRRATPRLQVSRYDSDSRGGGGGSGGRDHGDGRATRRNLTKVVKTKPIISCHKWRSCDRIRAKVSAKR